MVSINRLNARSLGFEITCMRTWGCTITWIHSQQPHFGRYHCRFKKKTAEKPYLISPIAVFSHHWIDVDDCRWSTSMPMLVQVLVHCSSAPRSAHEIFRISTNVFLFLFYFSLSFLFPFAATRRCLNVARPESRTIIVNELNLEFLLEKPWKRQTRALIKIHQRERLLPPMRVSFLMFRFGLEFPHRFFLLLHVISTPSFETGCGHVCVAKSDKSRRMKL